MERRDRLILVVEDEPGIRRFLAQLLRCEGYRVLSAGDVESALRAVFKDRPDLIVLDRFLPDAEGTEVCRRVRLDAALAPTPIQMLSACAPQDPEEQARLAADDYLSKPFEAEEVLSRVAGLLRDAGVRGPL
ncbi:MAG: response regulator [Elusimicrobia bacterium]|nr:response regulator [Elusimicrobiota bacterium]